MSVSIEDVRVEIYRSFIEDGRAPMPAEISNRLGLPLASVTDSLRQLHDWDVIVLSPGTNFIWLAHPFSALDAPFRVIVGERTWEAICIWDALGVLAVLESDGALVTACPDCGDRLQVEVRRGRVSADLPAVVHFGVPASRWYEDVGFT